MTLPCTADADTVTSSSAKVLNQRITHVQTALKQAQHRRSTLQSELSQTETNSGRLQIKIAATKKSIQQQQRKLKQLKQLIQQINIQLKQQQTQLAQQLQARYILGNQPYFKLLLDHNNSTNTDRMIMYSQYLNHATIKNITQTQQSLTTLHTTQQQLQQHFQQLQNMLHQQLQQTQQYQTLGQQRQQLMQRINLSIKTHQQKLEILTQNKQQLENTVNQLNQTNGTKSYPNLNFSALQGRLNWPSQGKILNRYGHTIKGSQLKWGGTLIEAPENQPIYAIAAGNVVFSKWLAGYGQLIIINHGHGYMSLYGRLNSAYTTTGEHVHAGEKIATVGESGGFKKPALYFAIRHNAQPLNPTRWCR